MHDQEKKNDFKKSCLGCLGIVVAFVVLLLIIDKPDDESSSKDKFPNEKTKVRKYIDEATKIHMEVNKNDDFNVGPLFVNTPPKIDWEKGEVIWEVTANWYKLSKSEKEIILSGECIGICHHEAKIIEKVVFICSGKMVGYAKPWSYVIVVY